MNWVVTGSVMACHLFGTITWTNADLFSIRQFGAICWNKNIFIKENLFKVSSAKYQPFCSGFNLSIYGYLPQLLTPSTKVKRGQAVCMYESITPSDAIPPGFSIMIQHHNMMEINHYSDITWPSSYLKSPATLLLLQQLVYANIRWNIKTLPYWPDVRRNQLANSPHKKTSNVESISMWWHHHVYHDTFDPI